MPAVNLSPLFNAGQLFTNGGLPLSGGLINTYQAGTSTPLATYTDSAGTITNANPIVLNASGRVTNEIWLLSGSSYKLVLTDSLLNVLGTFDNIKGINDLSNVSIAGTLAVAGNTTLTNLSVTGNTTLGDAAGDGLTINSNAVAWPNNPTHSGLHTFSSLLTGAAGMKVGNTASADVATLDYYLEGTFTPTVGGSIVVGVPTYTIQTGTYVRIGKLVTVSYEVAWSALGAATGNLVFTGLPITAGVGQLVWTRLDTTAGNALPALVSISNATTQGGVYVLSAGNWIAKTVALSGSGDLVGSFSYFA